MSPKEKTFIVLLLTITIYPNPSSSSTESFVYGGCSQLKYTSGSPYESSVNSMLTSLVNSAMLSTYNNFTIQPSTTTTPQPQDTLYGLYQCRGDLSSSDCSRCVARAVSQLGGLCLDSCGGALQLEGCFVKYDNASFLGVEDKTVVMPKCGQVVGFDSDGLARRDSVLDYLVGSSSDDGSGKLYRVGGSGNIQGVGQCVGDLSPIECRDCLSEATGRLKTECTAAAWGDMYLAKCYARYSIGGSHSRANKDDNGNDDEIEKTLAILVGLIAGVALLIVFLSFLRKVCEKGKR